MRKLSRKEAEEKMEAIFSALHYNLMDEMNAGGERTGEESYFHAEAWKVDQGRQKEDYRQTVMSLDSVGFKEYYKLVGQFATAYKIGCWKEYSECEPILIEELGEELGRREKTKEKLELINSFRLEELRSQTFSFDAKINALQDILDDFRVGNEKEEVINRLLASFSGKDSGAFIARLQSDRKLLNGLLGRVNYVDLWGLLASDGKIDWIKEVSDVIGVKFGAQVSAGINVPDVFSFEVEVDLLSVNYEDGIGSLQSGVNMAVSIGNEYLPIGESSIGYEKEVEMSGSQTAFDLLNTDYEFVSETTVNQDFTVTIPTKFGLSVDINFTELSDLIIKFETQLINKIKDKS